MRSLLLVALWALLLAIPAPLVACGIAARDGESVDVASETALIVWDEANQIEHFIRMANFESSAYDFGFLVPTPSLPNVAESDEAVFPRLADMTRPRIETRTRTASLGCGMMKAEYAASEAAGKGDGVMVLQQGRVGDHDLVSLKFDPKAGTVEEGSRALADWLVRFGYGFGPTLKDWIEPYVKNDWVITAFRIAGEPMARNEPTTRSTGRSQGVSSRGPHQLQAKPVRLSFKTPRPFYPYREPTEPGSRTHKSRLLRVFFVAEKRFEGTLGESGSWPARTVWANTLQGGERQDAILRAKLPANAGPANWYLTEFEDRSSPRPATDEVWFRPAADQSPVARPPIIHWQYSYMPWNIGLALCLGLPMLTFVILWLKRRAVS